MFLYLILDAPAVLTDASQYGLGHIGQSLTCREVSSPMGRGTLIGRGDVQVIYQPEHQTWRRIPDRFVTGQVWCGWWNDKVPNAQGLARKDQLEGDEIELINGERWVVPRLRKYLDSEDFNLNYATCLPSLFDYNEEGRLILGDVVPKYRKIWEKSKQVADEFIIGASRDGIGEMSEDDLREFAGELICLNYYALMFEMVVIGEIGTDQAVKIVRSALHIEGLEERLKKMVSHQVSSGTTMKLGE